MRIKPFRLERWLLRNAELDLGGGGVSKLRLGDVLPSLDPDTLMKYGRTDGSDELKEKLMEWFPGVEPENILITSGTSEANLILNLTVLESGDHYLTENPQYEQTTGLAKAMGVKVDEFQLREEDEWRPDIEEIKEKVTPKTRVVFLDNPNNPTGAVLTRNEMKAISEIADDAGAYLHCDNALRGSELNGEPALTPLGFTESGVVTGSVSKLGATSPRIGWIIGEPSLIERCWVMKDYTTLGHSGLGEAVAIAILTKREQLKERNLQISRTNLKTLGEWVKERPDFDWRHPDAGFTGFPRYIHGIGSEELCERLLTEKGVLMSPGSFFGKEHHLRINTGSRGGALAEGLARLGGLADGLSMR